MPFLSMGLHLNIYTMTLLYTTLLIHVSSFIIILLISDIILFIFSFHYIQFRMMVFWSFHNSVLVTCPSSFLFHILFDFYVPSTYCTNTFHLDRYHVLILT